MADPFADTPDGSRDNTELLSEVFVGRFGASDFFDLRFGELGAAVLVPLLSVPRPFLYMSMALSRLVPRNRLDTRTHFLLSHLWSTQRPFGIGPFCRVHSSL